MPPLWEETAFMTDLEVKVVHQWYRFYRKWRFAKRLDRLRGQNGTYKLKLAVPNPGPKVNWRAQIGVAQGRFENRMTGMWWWIVRKVQRTQRHLTRFLLRGHAKQLMQKTTHAQEERQNARAIALARRAAAAHA